MTRANCPIIWAVPENDRNSSAEDTCSTSENKSAQLDWCPTKYIQKIFTEFTCLSRAVKRTRAHQEEIIMDGCSPDR